MTALQATRVSTPVTTAARSRFSILPIRHRRAAVVAIMVAAVLLPWSVTLAHTLPSVATAQHWSIAWVGLDLGEAAAAALTVLLIIRRDPRAALTATVGAAFLLCDAWFDVLTAAGGFAQIEAILEAALIEVPLAAGALWYAARTLGTATQRP